MQRLRTDRRVDAAAPGGPESSDDAGAASGTGPWRDDVPSPAVLAAGLAVAVAVAFCFLSPSELWLDEALSVHIAELPLDEMPDALRHDGSPPLYYFLLHGWMTVFGDSNVAVRALSGAFAVASLPLMWLAGRRLGGDRTAWPAMILLASSPFAVHQATQARMYSLLVLLCLLGFLALTRILHRPTAVATGGLAVVSGLLALTHYWAFYLIAATVVVLAAHAIVCPSQARRRTLLAIVAMCAGGALFLPWLRSFVFQIRHTGTPWARPAQLRQIFDSVGEFAGGQDEAGRALLLLLLGLAALGLFGRGLDGRRIELDLRTRPPGRGVALVSIGTLVLGISAGLLFRSGFAARYTAVALAPFLLLVALGVSVLLAPRVRHGVMSVAVVLGLVGGWTSNRVERTEAGVIAAALEARAGPDDLIAYCPDQLGPAVSRLLPDGLRQLTFPAAGAPQRVDWVDYEQRQKASNPTAFAEFLDAEAGDSRQVWMVWAPGYRTFKNFCQIIDRDLGDLRPAAEVVVRWQPNRYGEAAWLVRYPPVCRRTLAQRHESPAPGCPIRDSVPQR